MSEIPERIWARPDNKTWGVGEIKSKTGDWFPFHSIEYIRADLVAEKDAECIRLYKQIDEKDAEIERLRKALDEIYDCAFYKEYWKSEAEVQNPDARRFMLNMDDSILDVAHLAAYLRERDNKEEAV